MARPPANPSPEPTPAAPGRGLERRVAFEAVRQRLFSRPALPVTIGRFVVTQRVGEGGMGVVYAAYDPRLQRKVALKVVRRLSATPRAHALLEREARAAAGLSHPNVVTVYECGTADDGAFFIAMEFVEGQTLRQWLEAAPRGWAEVVERFAAAGRGLAAAHEAGIVHRDFKPDNVLVGPDGRARVMDFGLARDVEPGADVASVAEPPGRAGDDAGGSPSARTERSRSTLALGGGTPSYMAPEQHLGGRVGPAADQFALCVASYEALFGAPPLTRVEGDRRVPDTRDGRLGQAHRRVGVPRALVRAVLRGLEREPARRHPSVAALVERLEGVLRARRRRRWLGVGVGAAALAGAVGHGLAEPRPVDPCAGTEARMRETWSPARREAVAARLGELPSPLPERALARLDEYAAAWSAMRVDSCEATRVRGEQSDLLLDLRVACLDRRAYALEGLLARIEGASGRKLERAAALVHELVPLGVCEAEIVREHQAGANVARGRTDRSRDPDAEQAWQAAFRALEDATQRARLGEREAALEQLRGAEATARSHGLTQLEAEAVLLRVHLELERDPKADLRADLERALEQAQAAADSLTAVGCIAELLRLEREQPREGSDHSLLVALGRGLAMRTHDPPRARARLAMQEAALVSRRGDRDAAIEIYRTALAELDAAGVPASESLVTSLQNGLSAALIEGGHHDQAEPVLVALWETQRATLPPDAAALAPTALQLGHVARRAGRLPEALEHYRTAHRIFSARWGPEHGNTQVAALGLAKLHHQRGELEAAAQQYRAIVAGIERAHGPAAVQLVSSLEGLAELERERGNATEAVALAARATAVAETHLGADDPTTAAVRTDWGEALLSAGRTEDAVAQLDAAHRALQAEGTNLTWRGGASLHLARALHASSASPARVRVLVDEARRALTDAAARDVEAAAALDELRRFAAEVEPRSR